MRALHYVVVRAESDTDAKRELETVGIVAQQSPTKSSKNAWKFAFAEKTTFVAGKFKKVKLSDKVIAVYGVKPEKRTGQYNVHSAVVLEKYGEQPIKSITLIRTPVADYVNSIIDAISNNVWSELKKKYGYDVIYHLGMICEIGSKRILVEKNEVLNITAGFAQQSTSEFLTIASPNVTLSNMLDTTRDIIGDNRFFAFDGLGQQNCQDFLHDILDANGILTPEVSKWLYQPVDGIVNEIPAYIPALLRIITDAKKWIWLAFENPWLVFYKVIACILEFCLVLCASPPLRT